MKTPTSAENAEYANKSRAVFNHLKDLRASYLASLVLSLMTPQEIEEFYNEEVITN